MRGALLLFVAFAAGACTPRAPMPLVGTSDRRGPLRDAGAPARIAVASPIPADFRMALLRVNRDRFVSEGHAGGRFDADVYVTPSAKEAAFSLAGKIPPGTVLVMQEIERGTGGAGPLLMMEKKAAGFAPAHGDWSYTVVDGVAVSEGVIAGCAGCHDEAAHDHVFGVE